MPNATPNCARPWQSVEIAIGQAECPFLLLCDHATNLLPPQYASLGLGRADLNRHIAYDIGALGLSRALARRLGATLIFSRFSRLLIDPNRGIDDPTLIAAISDGAIVPGNRDIADEERESRISRYYAPYHGAIAAEIDARLATGPTPVLVSLHSFTGVWRGVRRPWHVSILWDKDPRLAEPLIARLSARPGLIVGDNEPYSGRLRNDTLYRHGTLKGLAHALIEVRQDLIADTPGQAEWADILGSALEAVQADPAVAAALSRVESYGSHTDIR